MPDPRTFGYRTGNVDKLDYDQAIAEGLGAVLDTEKNQYYLSLVDAKGKGIFVRPPAGDAPVEITRALVVFKKPEPTSVNDILPMIVINLDDLVMAPRRLLGVTEQYRVPADGAVQVAIGNTLGWSAYETREQEWPYDFTYTIEGWTRYRSVANQLLQMTMIAYPFYGSVTVTDSLQVQRVYHTFQEGTRDLTEIQSLVERYCGYALTIRVEGELTNEKVAIVAQSFVGNTIPGGNGPTGSGGSGGSGSGGGSGGIDPGPSGLIGDGQPAERVTFMESDE